MNKKAEEEVYGKYEIEKKKTSFSNDLANLLNELNLSDMTFD